MHSMNKYPDFSDFEVRLVKDAVSRMLRGGLFAPQDREDLEQELMLYIWEKKKEVPSLESGPEDSFRAMITTFVNKKVKELVRVRGECANEICYPEVFNRSREDVEEKSVMKMHLRAVLKELPPQQRRIAGMLFRGMRFTDIADELNITPSGVYSHIQKIREVFRREGLDEYLV